MNEAFEKIIEKLEERKVRDATIALDKYQEERCFWYKQAFNKAIEIVKQEAEQYNNSWIPCSERLPEENQQVILQDFYGNITIEKMKINDGVKGFSDGDWWSSANNYVAWQQLPEPFKERD